MTQQVPVSVDLSHGGIRVSGNRRHLIHEDGTPFFYLGDTAWELFHRLNREEADRYLEDRARKRYTVIQAVVLPEIDGLDVPNAYGEVPLHACDPSRPNEKYFEHVDYVIDKAASLGLVVGLLPTWGSYAIDMEHPLWCHHYIIRPDTAETYGRFLGERYGNRANIIWILGGDREPVGKPGADIETWRTMAGGIAEGVSGKDDYTRALMTYHPPGCHSTTEWLHEESWLSFNMCQTGHSAGSVPHEFIAADYGRTPVKPVLVGEPGYEAIPEGLRKGGGKMDDFDTRKFAYWSVFAGACGHTYGANEIWMMWQSELEPMTAKATPLLDAATPWYEAIDYPGGGQMQHLRALVESRPFLSRVPDQSMIVSGERGRDYRVQATRDADGSYAFVYTTMGEPVTVNLDAISGAEVKAWWFDPRTGESSEIGECSGGGSREFTPPSRGRGCDWVLVLDDAGRSFDVPGAS